MAKNKNSNGLVYSTNPNLRTEPEEEQVDTLKPGEQDLRIWLEKNHRG